MRFFAGDLKRAAHFANQFFGDGKAQPLVIRFGCKQGHPGPAEYVAVHAFSIVNNRDFRNFFI